jgi:hypothetical protein
VTLREYLNIAVRLLAEWHLVKRDNGDEAGNGDDKEEKEVITSPSLRARVPYLSAIRLIASRT